MRLLLLAVLITMPLQGFGSDKVQPLLERMYRAVDQLNYEGTVVFMHGDDVESMDVLHAFEDGTVRERVVTLNGSPRQVVRIGDLVSCSWAGTHSVAVDPDRKRRALPASIPSDLGALEGYYEFDIGDADRAAGRVCRYVRVLPRDALRYGYEFCLDEDSGLPLKVSMVDSEGRIFQQAIVTRVQVNEAPIPEARFLVGLDPADFDAASRKAVATTDRQAPDTGWEVGNMPPGFSLTQNMRYPMKDESQPVQHMVLSDGLATVSVFIAHADAGSDRFEGVTRSGAMHAYARRMGDHQITVVGEVPQKSVNMIGESIRYRTASND